MHLLLYILICTIGDVSVIVEYCEFGNLEEYLRNHRGTFYDEFTPTIAANFRNGMRATPRYVRLECQVKTSDLIKWAHQIAKGMAYLVERKVIHGDVALRNMLLDITQTVKIADFGLSKHIYTQTTVYQTKKKVLYYIHLSRLLKFLIIKN